MYTHVTPYTHTTTRIDVTTHATQFVYNVLHNASVWVGRDKTYNADVIDNNPNDNILYTAKNVQFYSYEVANEHVATVLHILRQHIVRVEWSMEQNAFVRKVG